MDKVENITWVLKVDGLNAEKTFKQIMDKSVTFSNSLTGLKAKYQTLKSVIENTDLNSKNINKIATEIKRTELELAQANKNLGLSFEQAGTSGKSAMTRLAEAGMVVTGLHSTIQLLTNSISQLWTTLNRGAEINSITKAFRGTTKDIELFRKATAGTVTDANLIKLANHALGLGMSIEQIAIAFSLAEDVSDRVGGTIEDNFAKIEMALIRGGRALSKLGISSKEYEANVRDLEKQLGIKLNTLEADEQLSYRWQALLKTTGASLSDVTNKVKDQDDKILALKTTMEQGRNEIGQLLADALEPLAGALDEVGLSTRKLIGGVEILGSGIISILPLFVQLRTASALATTNNLLLAKSFDAVSVSAGVAATSTGAFLSKLGLVGLALTVGYSAAEFYNKTQRDKLEKLRSDVKRDKMSLEELKLVITSINKILKQMEEGGKKGTIEYNEYLLKRNSYLMEFNALLKESNKLTQSQTLSSNIFNLDTATISEINAEIQKLKNKLEGLRPKVDKEEIERIKKLIASYEAVIDVKVDSEQVRNSFEKEIAKLEKQRSEILLKIKLTTSIKDIDVKTKEQLQAIAEQIDAYQKILNNLTKKKEIKSELFPELSDEELKKMQEAMNKRKAWFEKYYEEQEKFQKEKGDALIKYEKELAKLQLDLIEDRTEREIEKIKTETAEALEQWREFLNKGLITGDQYNKLKELMLEREGRTRERMLREDKVLNFENAKKDFQELMIISESFWNTVIDNGILAFEKIFGEANSLFEQFLANVLQGLGRIASAKLAEGLFGFILSIFTGGLSGAASVKASPSPPTVTTSTVKNIEIPVSLVVDSETVTKTVVRPNINKIYNGMVRRNVWRR